MTNTQADKLMTKEEVLAFNMWATYWNFLNSLEKAFSDELEANLKNKSFLLSSWIESTGFFNENGQSQRDNPECEEIYFQLQNHKSAIRIVVGLGKTNEAYLDLIEDEEGEGKSFSPGNHLAEECRTDIKDVFSPESIEAAVEWLEKGTLTEFAKKNFKED